jgi:hypothetical protein
MNPTTQHKAYNSAKILQLDTKPTSRHKGMQLDTKAYNLTQRPTTWYKSYNSTRRPTTRLQRPTTRHKCLQLVTKAYNSTQQPTTHQNAYNSSQKPTNRHKFLQPNTKSYKILLFEFYHQLPLTERILELRLCLLHVPMHLAKCHETLPIIESL